MTNSSSFAEPEAPPRAAPAAAGSRARVPPAIGIALAVGLGSLVFLGAGGTGLAPSARALGAVFCVALVLWVTEAIPVGATAMLVLALQPLLGATPSVKTAIAGFASPVVFFVIAMYCIAITARETGLDRRFAYWLLARSGSRADRVVLAFMLGTGAISTVMSDVPACAIWMSIALGVLDGAGVHPGASNFGRALMLGIPIASLIGGVATPAGSSVNVLGLDLLRSQAGVDVSFLAWTAIGFPLVVVLVPAAWWILIRVYPPEIATIGRTGNPAAERANLEPLSPREVKALLLFSTMLALWFASTWFPRQLDLTVIAIAGSVVMFLPGVGLLDWEKAQRGIGWDSVFLIGGVASLGAASKDTGLAAWLVQETLGGLGSLSPLPAMVVIIAFTVAVHLVLPVAPIVSAVLIPPMIVLAKQHGVPPAAYAIPVAFTASCAFLLPLDAVSLVTYSRGYYRMTDMLLPGTLVSLLWVALLTLLMATVGRLVGLM